MMHVFFVGDGLRDVVTVPRLVERILDCSLHETVREWARLHGVGRSMEKRFRFAIRQARDARADAIVATVDADKDKRRQKLRTLQAERDVVRQAGAAIPTALGEAKPHNEAWLLDDPVAVRSALRLAADAEFPDVRRVDYPKDALHALLQGSSRAAELPRVIWPDIARRIDPKRCAHAKETGFAAFAKDVQQELGPLATRDPTPL